MQIHSPIVTIMGHVNHGKTSLIESICFKDILCTEREKITQHIKAYNIITHNHKSITFIDTPGHELFAITRTCAAKLSDIIIIVIAVDEGLKQQTIESISYAKKLKKPIIIAISKFDKSKDNLSHLNSDLAKYNIISEDVGGDVAIIPISVKTRSGLHNIVAKIFSYYTPRSSNVLTNNSYGFIIDSRIDKNIGIIVTVILKTGTLSKGQYLFYNNMFFKVKTIYDDKNNDLINVSSSIPVHLIGMNTIPAFGTRFSVFDSCICGHKNIESTDININRKNVFIVGHGNYYSLKSINIIVRADTYGSLKVILNSIKRLCLYNIKIIVHLSNLGSILFSDINLASITKSFILSFNVDISHYIYSYARKLDVQIIYYSSIQALINHLSSKIKKILLPKKKKILLGTATIMSKINTSNVIIAGCFITQGTIETNSTVSIYRKDNFLSNCSIDCIKHFNKVVTQISKGMECGILFKGFSSFNSGDQIKFHKTVDIL